MTTLHSPPQTTRPSLRPRRAKWRTSLLAHGQPMVWLNGGALAICLFMVIGLLALVFYQGLSTFWPVPVVEIKTVGGAHYMGEVTRQEQYRPEAGVFKALPPQAKAQAEAEVEQQGGFSERRLLRTGNFELTNTHFNWVSDFEVKDEQQPEWTLLLERTKDGRFYGFPKAFLVDGKVAATDPAEIWARYNQCRGEIHEHLKRIQTITKDDIGAVNRTQEAARLAMAEAALDHGRDSPEFAAAQQRHQEVRQQCTEDDARLRAEIRELEKENNRYQMRLTTADGREKTMPVAGIVRAYPPNQLGFWDKIGVFLSRWWEFLSDNPRNANSEGGVFPAIWGTAAMTLLMSVLVVPFGVLAALYLREYAKGGFIVSAVRVAINNLAGVPSIVFGVFGLGFFCYIVGGTIDHWFFRANLPSPTFGKGGLIWAALTLALLTLPVVIVATEEALAAVPGSMREGSYACGASKWQTIRRIVLPRAMPGIMTGLILAMARGAGEVAPLMLVGAVAVADNLPIDNVFPYVHPQRSFLHLGFQIFDVGFQSPNSEAAKPMVYTITLLLISLIALLNLAAVWLRSRLRRRFISSQF